MAPVPIFSNEFREGIFTALEELSGGQKMIRRGKLVRDNIPEIIRSEGRSPVIHIDDDGEFFTKLLDKLREEALEACLAGDDQSLKNELIDIAEIVNAICEFKKFDLNELEQLMAEKAKKRGRFGKRIILEQFV